VPTGLADGLEVGVPLFRGSLKNRENSPRSAVIAPVVPPWRRFYGALGLLSNIRLRPANSTSGGKSFGTTSTTVSAPGASRRSQASIPSPASRTLLCRHRARLQVAVRSPCRHHRDLDVIGRTSPCRIWRPDTSSIWTALKNTRVIFFTRTRSSVRRNFTKVKVVFTY